MHAENTWGTLLRSMRRAAYYSVRFLTGYRVSVPVKYDDFRQISASFPISLEKARRAIPSAYLEPEEVLPGKSMLTVVGNEFRKVATTVPYNEVAMMLPVTYKTGDGMEEQHGVWFLSLPVSTEDARWYAVENMGLPKYVANIEFEKIEDGLCCKLVHDGMLILTLEVPELPTGQETWTVDLFSILNGKVNKTLFSVEGLKGTAEGAGASLTLGDHPVAEEMKMLDITMTSIGYEYSSDLRAILHKPIFL